jgi:type II secretory ATPase GspE/PulE/Tfp pilus assembly ATPase PilB-like protein
LTATACLPWCETRNWPQAALILSPFSTLTVTGIFELIHVEEKRFGNLQDIRPPDYMNMRAAGLEKVKLGLTSIVEVERVI